MDIQYIDKVTLKYGKFKLSDYLNQSNHNFATFLIDISQQDIIPFSGLIAEDLKENCKEGLELSSKGVYALYGERHCNSSDSPVEVFMIEKVLWESDDELLKELLIFHEVCHLLEKRNYYQNLNVTLSDHELKVGKKLNYLANEINDRINGWGNDEDHNQTFGAILFHFLRLYDPENCFELLAKSMIKNFLEDHTQTFKMI